MASDDLSIGRLNGHAVGIVLKELVRRALTTIRNERQVFEVTGKAGHSGRMSDVFTSADRKAQEVYLRSLGECFPDCGIVAEEDKVSVAPRNGCTAWFTVDPLDGTKAFIRRQSNGVGTMIALVDGGEVLSAYIGDVNTQEIYGYRPGSPRVYRISEFETAERLAHEPRPLAEQYILLRDPERAYGDASRMLLARFKSFEIEGGSIGIWLARLWKREVGAALLPPAWETPWDAAPVVGISRRLGYVHLRPGQDGAWQRFEPAIAPVVSRREHDLLIVHEADLPSLGVRIG